MDDGQTPRTVLRADERLYPEKNDIWLAALDGSDPHAVDSPSLIHSADGGKTWQTLTWHSPLLKQVPRYWLGANGAHWAKG